MHDMLTQASRQVAYLVVAHQCRAPSAHGLPTGLTYLLYVLCASVANHKWPRSSSSHLAVSRANAAHYIRRPTGDYISLQPRPSGLPYQDGLTGPGVQCLH